jgi:hypothetical protein
MYRTRSLSSRSSAISSSIAAFLSGLPGANRKRFVLGVLDPTDEVGGAWIGRRLLRYDAEW